MRAACDKGKKDREELLTKDVAEWVAKGSPQVPMSVQVQWCLACLDLPNAACVGCPCPQARMLLTWARKNRKEFWLEYVTKFRPPEPREMRGTRGPAQDDDNSDYAQMLKEALNGQNSAGPQGPSPAQGDSSPGG